jgi:prepilin-type N-terminal cleavage/methylation domain-containing protein
MRLLSQTKPTRPAFTLVELIVVIAIILALAALLLSAVFKAVGLGDELKNTNDIRQLDLAVQSFLTRYQVPYMPSRIVLCRLVSNYTTSQVDVDSNQYLTRLWPRLIKTMSGTTNGTTTVTLPSTTGLMAGESVTGTGIPLGTMISSVTNSTQIMLSQSATSSATQSLNFCFPLNWDGNPSGSASSKWTLQGPECLVFFLGGIPGNVGGVKVCQGFSTNPTNPTDNMTAAMNPPFYDFKSERLMIGPSSTFFQYLDAYGAANDSKSQPYLYFSSYKSANNYNRYGPTDCSMTLQCTVTSGSSTVSGLWNTNGLAVGQSVTGTGIPSVPVTTIAAIDPVRKTIMLSQSATGSGASANFGILPYVVGSNFMNPNSFQIISAGKNQMFGVGGTWTAATASDTYPPGSGGVDDQANFYHRPLGIPTP